ncbi:hypothetical protein B7486_56830 [cyanobacterium TDX16]|nr:hypothetical protein B7486_56830 [cyanobacterium TDX16]
MVGTMFSTYCPTCDTEVLLGTRRIVHFPGTAGPEAVLLRCTCGTVVSGAATRPEPETATAIPIDSQPLATLELAPAN